MPDSCPHLRKILDLQERISRRDFLDGALLASGAALLAGTAPREIMAQSEGWTGYTGEGDYKGSAGNTEEVVQNAHAVRDGAYDKVSPGVTDTAATYDCVVVDGGFSGLSAGLFFKQKASTNRTCLILDNARIFGGVAKRNEFIVDGHRLYAPQASVHFQPPHPNSFLKSVYDAIGLDWNAFKEYQAWQGPAPALDLTRSPYRVAGYPERSSYGFYFGAKFGHKPGIWLTDPWRKNLEGKPFSADERRRMRAWRHDEHIAPLLVYEYPRDAVSRQLDSMTLEDYWLRTYPLTRDLIRLLLVSDTAGGFGLGPDALSGFMEYTWSRTIPTLDDSMETGLQMFPGGNSGMTRLLVKTLIPNSIEGERSMEAVWKNSVNFAALDHPGQQTRLRLDSTVVRVDHAGDPHKAAFAWVTYTSGGRLYRAKAKTVVMAGGGWITKHVVRDLDADRRAAYATFNYAPYMTANVAVRN